MIFRIKVGTYSAFHHLDYQNAVPALLHHFQFDQKDLYYDTY